MSKSIFFVYDSHCPWSYAATPLVKAIVEAFPDIEINLWHAGRYEGDENVSTKTLAAVEDDSATVFTQAYRDQKTNAADSTIAANIMAWFSHKDPVKALEFLVAMQKEHFNNGNSLKESDDYASLIQKFKLSLPKKALSKEKYTKDAEFVFGDVEELQEMIGTKSIPALLFANNDELILLNHNLYLKEPSAIVDAIKLELK